jgi:hypothetical protein
VKPPKYIEEVNVPSYMPTGYTSNSTLTKKAFMMDYYNQIGENVITFKQRIISSGSEGDAEEGTANEITINGFQAIVISYADHPNEYVLYWQDNQYRYSIHGYFEDYDELIRMATSVKVN